MRINTRFHPSTPASYVQIVVLAGMMSLCASAQTPQSMTVSPDQATMLAGETRIFHAVGKDGRVRHNVRWGISPQNAAAITVNGDEVMVQAREESPNVLLTASAESDSAEASIEIRRAGDMPVGTRIWSVSPTPGCKATKMTQAVPSANGPDLYVEEACPEGSMIRALTSDGRELWRRPFRSSGAPSNVAGPIAQGPYVGMLPNGVNSKAPGKVDEATPEHVSPHAAPVCDAIRVGMTRDDVFKTIADHKDTLDARQRQSNNWSIEEKSSLCAISFDANTGTVVKKKKTIVIE